MLAQPRSYLLYECSPNSLYILLVSCPTPPDQHRACTTLFGEAFGASCRHRGRPSSTSLSVALDNVLEKRSATLFSFVGFGSIRHGRACYVQLALWRAIAEPQLEPASHVSLVPFVYAHPSKAGPRWPLRPAAPVVSPVSRRTPLRFLRDSRLFSTSYCTQHGEQSGKDAEMRKWDEVGRWRGTATSFGALTRRRAD